jgi:hypothetical protein
VLHIDGNVVSQDLVPVVRQKRPENADPPRCRSEAKYDFARLSLSRKISGRKTFSAITNCLSLPQHFFRDEGLCERDALGNRTTKSNATNPGFIKASAALKIVFLRVRLNKTAPI